jgi:hypothetical protein
MLGEAEVPRYDNKLLHTTLLKMSNWVRNRPYPGCGATIGEGKLADLRSRADNAVQPRVGTANLLLADRFDINLRWPRSRDV